ncbi:response regulator [Polaribacter ponticola]|uniref:Response regulator n=1 Tax=Polaribacter ponticola TaxID=2978475 RepID=A0ABT5SDV2_9FLAO|nr:response regulator [Polaribacter sp. MSW5]MDD7915735.1 response regulator [Polaribacter sp. MSW5]
MKKFNCILLVDDDISTNRFHQIVIDSLAVTNNIVFSKNGKDALDYLMHQGDYANKLSDFIKPNLIFIDLNMPVMDGFRFIELYTKTSEFNLNKPRIIVLSTTLIPEEKEKIEANENIFMFLNKPLSKSTLKELFNKM